MRGAALGSALAGAVLGAALALGAGYLLRGEFLRGAEEARAADRRRLAETEGEYRRALDDLLALYKGQQDRVKGIARDLAVQDEHLGAFQKDLEEFRARFDEAVRGHLEAHKRMEEGEKGVEERLAESKAARGALEARLLELERQAARAEEDRRALEDLGKRLDALEEGARGKAP